MDDASDAGDSGERVSECLAFLRDSASEPHKKEINSARQKKEKKGGRKGHLTDERGGCSSSASRAPGWLILLRKFSLSPSPNTRPRAGERDADDVVDSDGCLRHIVSKEGGGERHRQKQRRRRHHVAAYFKTPTKRKRERPPPPPFFRLLERKRGDSQSSVRRQREKESNTPLLLIVLPKTVRGDGEREGG